MFSMLSKLWKVEFYFEIYNQFLGELWFLSAYSFSSFLWWEGGAASVPDPYQSCKSLKIFLIPLLAQQGTYRCSSGVALHFFPPYIQNQISASRAIQHGDAGSPVLHDLPAAIRQRRDEELLQAADMTALEERIAAFSINSLDMEYTLWKSRWRRHEGGEN